MCKTDEYDELEMEAIADAPPYDDESNCDSERQIDEYGDHGIASQHYQNSGCGCLTLTSAALSITLATVMLVWAF